jgi:hypothetical protein
LHHLQKLTTTTTAAVAATAALLTASPAVAQVRTTADQTGDVWLAEDDGSYSQVEEGRTNVEVLRSRVRHTDHRVTAVVRYDDLVRNTDTTTAGVRLRTSGKETYLLQLSAGPGNRAGTVVFGRYSDDGFVDVACGSVREAVQYKKDRLVVSVGRACLGKPRWVRYGGGVSATEEGPGASYTDALLSGDPVNDLFSPRIKRG